MPLADLNENDRKVVWECIRSAAEAPFYPDWEFATLFGFERHELQPVLDSWSDIDDSDEATCAIISNSMNNLLFYPIDNRDLWGEYISVPPDEVARIFAAWRGNMPASPLDGMR